MSVARHVGYPLINARPGRSARPPRHLSIMLRKPQTILRFINEYEFHYFNGVAI